MSLNLYTILIIIAAVSVVVEGFVVPSNTQQQSLLYILHSTATPFFFATTEVDNDAPIPANPASASGPLDHEVSMLIVCSVRTIDNCKCVHKIFMLTIKIANYNTYHDMHRMNIFR